MINRVLRSTYEGERCDWLDWVIERLEGRPPQEEKFRLKPETQRSLGMLAPMTPTNQSFRTLNFGVRKSAPRRPT